MTITTKIAHNGVKLYYLNGKRVSQERARKAEVDDIIANGSIQERYDLARKHVWFKAYERAGFVGTWKTYEPRENGLKSWCYSNDRDCAERLADFNLTSAEFIKESNARREQELQSFKPAADIELIAEYAVSPDEQEIINNNEEIMNAVAEDIEEEAMEALNSARRLSRQKQPRPTAPRKTTTTKLFPIACPLKSTTATTN